MKTKLWALTALAFFIVAIGIAAEFPKIKVIAVEPEKAMVVYSASAETPLEITLSNKQGEVLYFKRTEKRCSEYSKVFDFSQLGDGIYDICINYGNKSVGRTLTLKDQVFNIGPSEQHFEPLFTLKDDKLNVSFLNCCLKPVTLHVYKKGRHIESVRLGKDLAIQKCFDLSELKKGEYDIVLSGFYKDHRFRAQL
jgi:hypothetical protein